MSLRFTVQLLGCVVLPIVALGQAPGERPRPGHVTRTAGLAKGCCEKSDLLFVVLLVVLAQQVVAEVVLQVARNTVDVVGAVLRVVVLD